MSFAEKLKALREENHYTQKYVAQYLNVSRSTIAGYETKNRQPSHEKLTILAELFHVSVDFLIDSDTVDHIEPSLSGKISGSRSTQYLITHFQHLSSHSKKDLLEFLDFLELRDKTARTRSKH